MLYLGTTKDDDIQNFDSALSTVSENAVQNKVVTKKLNELSSKIESVVSSVNNIISKLEDELDLFKTGLLKQIEQDMAKMAKADGSNLKYPHILEMDNGKTSDGKTVYYRRYADGWCEQWGQSSYIVANNGPTSVIVNLYFQYKDTTYITLVTGKTTSNGEDSMWVGNKTKTNNSFKIYMTNNANGSDGTAIYPCWYTAGYVS